jgi:hypothetical protein
MAKITLLLHKPSMALDGSQEQTHGIEWSGSGSETSPMDIVLVKRESPGLKPIKREFSDVEILTVSQTGEGRKRPRRVTRASEAQIVNKTGVKIK